MTSVLLIDKSGGIKEQKIKSFDKSEFFKKCGFRSPNNFAERTIWKKMKVGDDLVNVSLFAKDKGKAGFENKYDLPPPIDKELFFGTMMVVGEDAELNTPYPVTKEMWEKIYEKLFGGFEDITQTDDETEEDEMDDYPDEMKTKEGYLKDGFVVDDNALEEGEEGEEEEEEEEEEEDEEDDEENFDSELEYEEYEYEGHD